MQHLAEDFWNFRGSFKIAGFIDVGTQMSLVRRANGRFLLLDSYGVEGEDKAQLLELTDGGAAIDAIINVHPFHTIHCEAAHRLAPAARLIGTARHRKQAPDLPWDEREIEQASTQAEFADDLQFTVPAGVDLVTDNDSVHAGSVIARHRASGIVHVDDTFNVIAAPGMLNSVLPQSSLKFHPMLPKALEKRPGAADDFAAWARRIADEWAGTPIVCAAHSAVRELSQDGWHDEVLDALDGVEKTLAKHRAEYG